MRSSSALRPALAVLAAIALLWLGAGLGSGVARGEAVYRFGVPPWQRGQSADEIRQLYRPMLDHLTRAVGGTFTLVTARNYDDMVRYFAEGRVELGTISPGPYVLAQRLNPGVRALLTELSWNSDRTARQDSYQGLILTLASRDDINDLADLAGKAFGFVTAESTSGFIIPNAVLRQHGIDYQTAFASHVFLGSHPRVTDALVAGSIDAGATWDFNLAQAIEKHGNRFKIISRTAIPNLLIAVHPSLPDPVTEQIKTALLGIDPQLLAGLPTAGYVERPESFYDDIRAIVDLLPR